MSEQQTQARPVLCPIKLEALGGSALLNSLKEEASCDMGCESLVDAPRKLMGHVLPALFDRREVCPNELELSSER
jgi:hypothetical protein